MGLKEMFTGKPNTSVVFKPNCRPIEGSDGKAILECKPEMVVNGKQWVTERPVKMLIERGHKSTIIDDGGAQDFLLDRLLSYIERKRLNK